MVVCVNVSIGAFEVCWCVGGWISEITEFRPQTSERFEVSCEKNSRLFLCVEIADVHLWSIFFYHASSATTSSEIKNLIFLVSRWRGDHKYQNPRSLENNYLALPMIILWLWRGYLSKKIVAIWSQGLSALNHRLSGESTETKWPQATNSAFLRRRLPWYLEINI